MTSITNTRSLLQIRARRPITASTSEMPDNVINVEETNSSTPLRDREPIAYGWRDISAATLPKKPCLGMPPWKRPQETPSKVLLHPNSGWVEPGELCAIMGCSGAGKSTLLNTLTLRNVSGLKVTGERLVNGVPVSPESLTSLSAYVQQDDLFIGTLTVREHLRFQARVRMDSHIPLQMKFDRVEKVIEELGLRKCADVLIGVQGRIKGISGGESKRLAFASEVLTNPSLMFCDEPTSGLDSYMAENVVDVLKGMTKHHKKTVICTIHQPSSQVFAKFDKLLLMTEGKTAYFGPMAGARDFMESCGLTVPEFYNPADFYIQSLAVTKENTMNQVMTICDRFADSEHGSALKSKLAKVVTEEDELAAKSVKKLSPYKASWCEQFAAVFLRTLTATLKEPMAVKIKLLSTLFISTLLGLIYMGQEKDQAGIMNINGALFIIVTNLSFDNIFTVATVFCAELPVFLREHSNGMYRTDVYFLAKQLVDAPIYVLSTCVTVTLLYWLPGMNPDPLRFLIALGIANLLVQTIVSFGYLLSCLVPSMQVANDLAPAVILPLMLMGGFFLNSVSIPAWLIWLKYVSWFFYGNQALVVNQWHGMEGIECEAGAEAACLKTGDEVLSKLNFPEDDFYFNLLMLFVLLVVFRVLAFIALYVKSRRRN